jgi:DNA polymerase III gamma/tau subunit
MQLYEQYRPTTFDEVLGQDKALAKVAALARRGLAGRAYWISGQSGTGKTTIARILAAEAADDFNIQEIDAAEATVNNLKDLEHDLRMFGFGSKSGKAVIINESHGLRKDSIRHLLVMLERIPAHVIFIFTTTCEGQQALFDDYDDANPLLSRCIRIDLARRDLAKPFAAKVQEIATKEGLNGQPIEAYVKLAQRCKNNMRAMFQAVEAGEMLAE